MGRAESGRTELEEGGEIPLGCGAAQAASRFWQAGGKMLSGVSPEEHLATVATAYTVWYVASSF